MKMKIHREGKNILLILFIILALLNLPVYLWIKITWLAYLIHAVYIIFFFMVVNFFRSDKRMQVSIFMNIFNVHANWFPVAGKVIHVSHQQGRFMAAYLPKSSTDNERSTVVIKAENGEEILVRQIAGAVARRIVTYAEVGDTCDIDEHMGFIKFGSRVDLYLPLDCDIKVALHDKTIGDLTEIARLK